MPPPFPTVLLLLFILIALALPCNALAVSKLTLARIKHAARYAADAYCPTTPLPVTQRLIYVFHDEDNIPMGRVFVDKAAGDVVVAFAGTKSWGQLMTKDMDVRRRRPKGFDRVATAASANSPSNTTTLAPFKAMQKAARMHSGFADIWDLFHAPLLDAVVEAIRHIVAPTVTDDTAATSASTITTPPPAHYKILLTGHSLGAVSATLGYPYLALHLPHILPRLALPAPTHISTITFGGPRFANYALAKYILRSTSVSDPILRVTKQRDPIVRIIPKSFGYVHVGQEIMFPSRWQSKPVKCMYSATRPIEDPACSMKRTLTFSTSSNHSMYFGVRFTSIKCPRTPS